MGLNIHSIHIQFTSILKSEIDHTLVYADAISYEDCPTIIIMIPIANFTILEEQTFTAKGLWVKDPSQLKGKPVFKVMALFGLIQNFSNTFSQSANSYLDTDKPSYLLPLDE